MSRYTYVWEYRVAAENEAAFLEHYRPGGSWAELFSRAEGYLETRLLRDLSEAGRYLTVDRWESAGAFEAFRARFDAEFAALDRRCEALTLHEAPLGSFVEVDPAGEDGRLG